jgi:hypothetical protein
LKFFETTASASRVVVKLVFVDPKFNLDFNTAFPTGPARPHGIAIR